MIRQNPDNYIDNVDSSFKKGLDFQRERFKQAKFDNDYDCMCDALENIKSEIRVKILQKNNSKALIKIEKIIDWYRTIETRYIKNTPQGKSVVFPPNIHYKANRNLTKCYELLIDQLNILKLL